MSLKKESKRGVTLLVAGGGFLYESMRIAEMLAKENIDFNFAVSSDITFPIKSFPPGNIDLIEPLSLRAKSGFFKTLNRCAKSIYQSFNVIRTKKSSVVILVGSSMALPLAIFAKLYGKKIVFIETVTRTKELSSTGIIFHKFSLANRLYVQWPELEKKYKNAVFKGSII